jgi:hypothetical protein
MPNAVQLGFLWQRTCVGYGAAYHFWQTVADNDNPSPSV